MEAVKIKKKLNGSILKGSKMKIEEARPEKKMKRSAEEEDKEEVDAERRARRVAKKRKREEGVLPGFELPKERKVKRGWTEPAASSKSWKGKGAAKGAKEKESKKPKATVSQFSNEPELLFRTQVPPNATNNAKTGKGEKKAGKSGKSRSDREVVVHEFSNTTKHASFLREQQASNGKKATSDFVEGKGWVDEDGNVIEAPPEEKRPTRKPVTKIKEDRKGASRDHASDAVDPDETSSSGSSSSSEDNSEESEAEKVTVRLEAANAASTREVPIKDLSASNPNHKSGDESDATSSSGTSSSSASDSSSPSSSKDPNLPTLAISSPLPLPPIHPLEALFKKPHSATSSTPRKPNLEVKTSFSFFDPDAPDDSVNRLMPQTPFTQRDLQYRSVRSAAPTPDTAAPNKTGFGNLWGGDDEETEEDEEGEGGVERTPVVGKGMVGKGGEVEGEGESEFSKWFWEHRGETNRAWKKRKREAAKEKRQRGNSSKRKGRDGA